jgi:group I intron endonuclease
MIGIYKITNPKGKIYIGQSTNIEERWEKGHKYNSGSGKKLKNSLNKYGWENHKKEILEECVVEHLSERETYWIEYYDSYKKGLNSTSKGGIQGYKDEQWRKTHSEGLKGRKGVWESKTRPEHSAFLKENGCGLSYERTQEHKDNLSIIMKEVWKNKKEEISKKITQNKIGKGLKSIICDTLFGMEFKSLSEASEVLNLNKGNICEVLKGNKIHIKGFVFRYKDLEN